MPNFQKTAETEIKENRAYINRPSCKEKICQQCGGWISPMRVDSRINAKNYFREMYPKHTEAWILPDYCSICLT